MSAARACWLLALLAAPAAAAPPPAATAPCAPKGPQLFVSPMGEPFRAAEGAPAPATAWFAAADADHDGRLTAAEMTADADRFFATLDRNRDGELAPDEIADYENHVAPEIRLYQTPPWPGAGPPGGKPERRHGGRRDDYGGAIGAGRYAWLNIPEPVAAADLDANRGVSRAEFRAVAAERFRLLDTARAGALTLAALPPTPAQAAACPPPRKGRSGR